MMVSDLGFTFYGSKFEDGALVDGDLAYRSFSSSFPSVTPRSHLHPPLTEDNIPPYSLLFHLRSEKIRNLLWKTTPSRTKSPSESKVNIRKRILNCPPEEMLALLKAQGLLNDDEPIPTATKLKPVLPSIPSVTNTDKN